MAVNSQRLRPWVYPRVGGGTGYILETRDNGVGLSPRGRGNRQLEGERFSIQGSIPAWAGEPWPAGISWRGRWVYPRVGGGTFLRRV